MFFSRFSKKFGDNRERFSYVIINILMAVLGFVRSYITMKYLGFYEVGMIAVVQSVIEVVSMLQLGIINGAFRMFFINTKTVNERINSMVFTYLGILSVSIFFTSFLYFFLTTKISSYVLLLLLGGLVGIFTLAKTWLSNLLIAEQRLKMLNNLNILSTVLSFLFLFLLPSFGLLGCVLLIISQPILFIVFALTKSPELRPTKLLFEKKILRKMLAFGFIPFLAAILIKIDDQVERWGIIESLGIEELGKYNLVLIYCSVFMLIPTSINPIFFPKTILLYKNNDFDGVKRTMKKYVIILFCYAIIAFTTTVLFLPYIVNLLLPKYNIGVPYLWYIFPYLLAQILIMPLDFIYTIAAKYKIMFFSYSFAVILFVSLVIYISKLDEIKLEYFPIAKSIDGACFLVVSYICYYIFFENKSGKSIFKNQL